MNDFHHNLVSLLYVIKETSRSHFVLSEEGRWPEPAARLHHAEEILRKHYAQAARALEILKRIRLMMRKEKGGSSKPSKASLGSVWGEVLALLEKEFGSFPVEVITHIPEGFPPLQCESGELKEILYQLALNALQATAPLPSPRGGAGEVRGKLIFRAALGYSTQEEPPAILTLADTGPGIAAEHLPSLFQPFFTTKPEGEGNGLGLYLVKGLAEKNGGRIRVQSFEGFGTTFTLDFGIGKREGVCETPEPGKNVKSLE